jgi:hypothetical protein
VRVLGRETSQESKVVREEQPRLRPGCLGRRRDCRGVGQRVRPVVVPARGMGAVSGGPGTGVGAGTGAIIPAGGSHSQGVYPVVTQAEQPAPPHLAQGRNTFRQPQCSRQWGQQQQPQLIRRAKNPNRM